VKKTEREKMNGKNFHQKNKPQMLFPVLEGDFFHQSKMYQSVKTTRQCSNVFLNKKHLLMCVRFKEFAEVNCTLAAAIQYKNVILDRFGLRHTRQNI